VIAGLTVAVFLLAVNGAFVAMEFSAVAAQRGRVEQRAATGERKAVAAQHTMSELSFMLSAAQLGVTVASLALGYVAEPTVAEIFHGPFESVGLPGGTAHSAAFVVALSIVVFMHMVVGEMVPKRIAIAEPERTLLWLAVPMRVFARVFRPVILVLNHVGNSLVRLAGVEPADELSDARTGEELVDLLAVSRREGILEDVEHQLLTGALRFPARLVATVMTPREQMVAVGAGTVAAQVEKVACESGHSRIVVYGRDLDDVLGFVHAKDLLAVPVDGQSRPLPTGRLRRMLVQPADATLQQVLLAMRGARVHAALVVDQGRTVGIVTLEDLLEALVGDIRDEHD
jgi:CBS domain containing-hemolysin-like protein